MNRVLFFTVLLSFAGILPAFSQKGKDKISEDWNHKLKVDAGAEKFSGEKWYAYSFEVYEAKAKEVEDIVSDEFKKLSKDHKSAKKMISALQASLPRISSNALDVHAIVDAKGSGAVRVSLAFLEAGVPISPQTSKDGDRAAKDLAAEYAVQFNKAIVAQQVEEQEKELEKMQKDLEKAKKNHGKLAEDVTDYEEKMKKAEEEKVKLEAKLAKQKSQDLKREAKSQQSGSSKELKRLAKERKDVEKVEKQLEKLASDQVDYESKIAKAKADQPEAEKEMKDLEEQVAAQNSLVENLRKKLADIK